MIPFLRARILGILISQSTLTQSRKKKITISVHLIHMMEWNKIEMRLGMEWKEIKRAIIHLFSCNINGITSEMHQSKFNPFVCLILLENLTYMVHLIYFRMFNLLHLFDISDLIDPHN